MFFFLEYWIINLWYKILYSSWWLIVSFDSIKSQTLHFNVSEISNVDTPFKNLNSNNEVVHLHVIRQFNNILFYGVLARKVAIFSPNADSNAVIYVKAKQFEQIFSFNYINMYVYLLFKMFMFWIDHFTLTNCKFYVTVESGNDHLNFFLQYILWIFIIFMPLGSGSGFRRRNETGTCWSGSSLASLILYLKVCWSHVNIYCKVIMYVCIK